MICISEQALIGISFSYYAGFKIISFECYFCDFDSAKPERLAISFAQLVLIFVNQSYNQEQKLLRQPHKCPPHPQFNVVQMTEKRKFKQFFPTLIMGAGGRPTYFKMAKTA
jgi:hypothetical protein